MRPFSSIRRGLLSGLVAATFALAACAGGEDGLDTLHADIVSDYPGVSHIDSEALAALERPVILDIRDPAEFAVSHIPGAVRVGLDEDAADVLARLDVQGRPVVAYCSVGRRSSIFAQAMQDALLAQGATSVANLQGGVFSWHAREMPLENAAGRTDVVHPYDEIWKRYVPRQDAVSYTPVPGK